MEILKPDKSSKTEESPRAQHTKDTVYHSIRFNQSYTSLEHMVKLINSTPGAQVQMPSTIYKIKKMVQPSLTTQFYIHCNSCDDYSMTTTKEAECITCGQILKRANSKYFVHLPLKPQIMKSINDHFEEIVSYDEMFREPSDLVRDFQDCIQYKTAKTKYPGFILLPLAINTDGAQIFNSSKKSIWPIQLYQKFLPPYKRYVQENILVTGIHEGNKYLLDICLSKFEKM